MRTILALALVVVVALAGCIGQGGPDKPTKSCQQGCESRGFTSGACTDWSGNADPAEKCTQMNSMHLDGGFTDCSGSTICCCTGERMPAPP